MSANHPYLLPRGLNWEGRSSDGIGRMHNEKHLSLPPHDHARARSTALRPDVFDWEPILEREENRSSQGKTLKSGWDRLKLSPRTIAEVGGANVEHNANLTSKATVSKRWVFKHTFVNYIHPNQSNIKVC